MWVKSIYHKVLNAHRMKGRRVDLRRKATPAEDVLWQKLRNNQLGLRFKRQYSVMNYVADFYCPGAKLAIELDGEIHETSRSYDNFRTKYLKSLGISEIRFNNSQIEGDMTEVIQKIRLLLPSPEVRRGIKGEVEMDNPDYIQNRQA